MMSISTAESIFEIRRCDYQWTKYPSATKYQTTAFNNKYNQNSIASYTIIKGIIK